MEANDPTEYYEIVEINPDYKWPIIIDKTTMQLQHQYYQQQQQQQQSLFPGPDRVKAIEANLAFWAVIDGVLLVFILSGNILTILAVRFSRRLRSVISNMFILSLAISDVVVGFTLPYHLAFYMGSSLGKSRGWCLLRFFLIILACCVSIWNLIAIAVDRYIAIVYPLHYSRYMTKKVAYILLGFGWILGITFALIPMFWNNWDTATQCEFDEILPPWYMAGVITPGFSMVWLCMLIVYWRIWREASKHAKQLRSSFTGLHETPSDWKSVQVVLFILGCFSICWLPYVIIACAQIFRFLEKSSPILYKGAFSLAMANSGINPIIYAWKNTSFRKAFAQLLRCKSPDHFDLSQYSTRSNIHRKSSSLHHQDTINGTVTNTPPLSAVSGHFNVFDETPYHSGSGSGGGRTGEIYENDSTPKISHSSRRVSLALTHTTIPLPPPPPSSLLSSSGQGQGQVSILTDRANVSTVLLTNKDTTTNHIPKYSTLFHDNGRNYENLTFHSSENISNGISLKKSNQLNNGIRCNGISNSSSARNIVIQQIECDGNGNTQIRLIQPKSKLKDPFLRNYENNELINKINSLKNSKSCELINRSQIQTKVSTINNGHNVIIEQLSSNGNHYNITNNMNNCDGQIV